METPAHTPGTAAWIDLGTPDIDRSAAFYTALFGWEVEAGTSETGGYRMCFLHGAPVAGLGPQGTPGVPPWWATYFAVRDVDATTAAVRAAGGNVIVEPMDVMSYGRMAVFADPAGALFSVWQAGAHQGLGRMGEPGAVCWVELTTRGKAAALAFYAAVFGWTSTETPADGIAYVELSVGAEMVGGLLPMEGDTWPADLPSHWLVYFAVADADTTAAQARELGGTVMVEPTDIPPGRFAVCTDPTGAVFAVLQLRPDLLARG